MSRYVFAGILTLALGHVAAAQSTALAGTVTATLSTQGGTVLLPGILGIRPQRGR